MDKEKVIENFNNMIIKSWTYARLTSAEKDQWKRTLESAPLKVAVKGTYKQRWNILNGIYTAFLYGCGYTDFKWRE